MKNDRGRSIVLGLAACGLLTWLPPSQAHGLGGAAGAGLGAGARAGGSVVGGRVVAMGGDVRMNAPGSLRVDSGSLRSEAGQ